MIKSHTNWPEIDQLRNVVREVQRRAGFMGLDENGEPIIDRLAQKPTITFEGTVKLHGTNAGVSYNTEHGIWAQSREHIITPEQDNAGFAKYVEEHKDAFMNIINEIIDNYNIESDVTITLFGEWAGKGIQSGVAIAQLEKAFYIFGIKVSHLDIDNNPEIRDIAGNMYRPYWLNHKGYRDAEHRIFNTTDYRTFKIDIDFNMPELIQNDVIKLVEEVENECPIAKAFGVSGVGEGIVWVGEYKGDIYRWKSKGEKHSISKVKTLVPVDTEKLNSVIEFVDYAVTQNRFDQAIEKVFGSDDIDIKRLGEVLKWMNCDINKEEADVLADNGLDMKDVGKHLTDRTKKMFMELMTK